MAPVEVAMKEVRGMEATGGVRQRDDEPLANTAIGIRVPEFVGRNALRDFL